MDQFQDPQYKTPDGSALRIWRDAAPNNYLTQLHGRQMFDEVIYVEVISPGSKDSVPTFEVVRMPCAENPNQGIMYGTKYMEYKEYIDNFEKNEDGDASMAGTPLAQWSEMSRTMVASLKAQSIFTVDALANLPDTRLVAVGPDGRTWREKAKAYIENSKSTAYATAIAAELENSLQRENDLKRQITELAGQVDALKAQINQTAPPQAPVQPPTPPSAPRTAGAKAPAESII